MVLQDKNYLVLCIFVFLIKNYILLKIAHHPTYIHPLPERHRFPMLKYDLIPSQLIYEGVVSSDNFFEPVLADFETICLAHDSSYVQQLFDLSIDVKMQRRIGFPLSKELIERERYLIDGTIKGALYALEYGVAFNTAGGTHHAGFDFGEGFCLLNDQAIAAAYLVKHNKARRILIIDLDVHQGNGTANIFEGSECIFTFSMHGDKNFPFVKETSYRDVAMADGIEDQEYLELLDYHLYELLNDIQPDFVFYQAGVDILQTDKLGKLKVSLQGCKERDTRVFKACESRNIPIQVSMGGGYSTHIKDIVDAHVQTYKVAIDIFEL